MKIEKVSNKLFLRIKLAEGSLGEEKFSVSMLANGNGVLVEFDSDKYLVPTEEIVKEVMRLRGRENELV